MTKYKTKTIRTGWGGSSRKIARYIAKGWEVVSETRHGFQSNIVILRKPKK